MPASKPKKFATELSDYAARRGTTGPYADDLDVDVLIVGAGFGELESSSHPFVILRSMQGGFAGSLADP